MKEYRITYLVRFWNDDEEPGVLTIEADSLDAARIQAAEYLDRMPAEDSDVKEVELQDVEEIEGGEL